MSWVWQNGGGSSDDDEDEWNQFAVCGCGFSSRHMCLYGEVLSMLTTTTTTAMPLELLLLLPPSSLSVFTCASSNLISNTRANFYNECSLASQPNMPKTISQSIRFERNAHGTGLLSSQFTHYIVSPIHIQLDILFAKLNHSHRCFEVGVWIATEKKYIWFSWLQILIFMSKKIWYFVKCIKRASSHRSFYNFVYLPSHKYFAHKILKCRQQVVIFHNDINHLNEIRYKNCDWKYVKLSRR